MIKLILIEKDIDLIKKLETYFENKKNIKICYSTTDGIKGLNYIKENYLKLNVLIIDLIVKNKDGISLMKELKERNINMPTIVCSSCNSNKMIGQASSYNICGYLLKPYDIKELENKIIDTVSNELCHKKIDEKIVLLLHSLGISSKYTGYKYLKDSIRMFYFYPDSIISKEIYSTLATKYNVSKSCIERSISRAIVSGFDRINYDSIESIFGNTINPDRGSPTNVELIETLAERLNIIYQHMI